MLTSRFRDRPPELGGQSLVVRHRLLEQMVGRFDRRVTTITASAGFGKTTLLAQALDQNRMQPFGEDAWLGCDQDDADAARLAGDLAEAVSGVGDRPGLDPVQAVCDAVWSRAPRDVALVLDDVHEIAPGSPGAELIARLVRDLPANGHLVLGGRSLPAIPLGRLRAAGDLLELGEADLAFDDDEFEAVTARSPGVGPDLRWPALAVLVARSGRESAIEYVWEEIVAGLDPSRRLDIARAALFDEVDDELLQAVTRRSVSAATLLTDLPLVTMSADHTFRLHALWAPVVADLLDATERTEVLRRGAEVLLERGQLGRATRAFLAADDHDGVERAIRAAVERPLTRKQIDDSRRILRALPPRERDGAAGVLLRADTLLAVDELTAKSEFERAAALAEAGGDTELEALALWRAAQLSGLLDGQPAAPHLVPRAQVLAERGSALAQAMVDRFTAYSALAEGDVDAALGHLPGLMGFGPVGGALMQSVLLMDVGRPEAVTGPAAEPGEFGEPPGDADQDVFQALAMWMRGEVAPEAGVDIALPFLDAVRARRVKHQTIATLGIVSWVALAAGRVDLAEGLVDEATRNHERGLGPRIEGYTELTRAGLLVSTGDEAAAANALAELVAVVPVEPWPARLYGHALALVYVLVPEARPTLDGCGFGRLVERVLDAARALVAVRDGDDPAPAAEVAWTDITLLRANIVVPHLVELAVAALAAGRPEARRLLDELPHVSEHLQRLADGGDGPVAVQARVELGRRPVRPGTSVAVLAFGELDVLIDGVPTTSTDWTRRERVRQILAYLVVHPRVTRRQLAEALWPDLAADKALNNLRVNLTYLQRVLEPEHLSGARYWFLETDRDTLVLHADRVDLDTRRFDELVEAARRHDDAGVPAEALRCYGEAADLHSGEFLSAFSGHEWCDFERLRYRSLATLASCRCAELLLARGEPEAALRRAGRALELEPLLERAHRVRVRALGAMGDRVAARDAAALVRASLTEAGLSPEPETATLFTKLEL